jgi:propionyl-CoA carboxylase alpha chain
VTPHYDAMLAKAVAWAPERELAAARLARALDRTVVHGVVTNAGLLSRVLREPDFVAGDTTTAFFDRHPSVFAESAPIRRHAVVAALARVAGRSSPVGFAPPGWRNVPGPPARRTYAAGGAEVSVTYRIDGAGRFEALAGDEAVEGRLVGTGTDWVDLEIDGVRRRYVVDIAGPSVHVHGADGGTTLVEVPRFKDPDAGATAGGLLAPVPGTVVAIRVEAGETVAAGQVLVVIEAMKVEHSIRAPGAGAVEAVLVAVGDSVEAHAPLVRMAE